MELDEEELSAECEDAPLALSPPLALALMDERGEELMLHGVSALYPWESALQNDMLAFGPLLPPSEALREAPPGTTPHPEELPVPRPQDALEDAHRESERHASLRLCLSLSSRWR